MRIKFSINDKMFQFLNEKIIFLHFSETSKEKKLTDRELKLLW